MRSALLLLLLLTGCTHHFGSGTLQARPVIDETEAYLSDVVVQKMLALREQLQAALGAAQERLALGAGEELEPLLSRRLSLTVALRDLDAAIEQRRAGLDEGGSVDVPPWLNDDMEEILADVSKRVQVARDRVLADGIVNEPLDPSVDLPPGGFGVGHAPPPPPPPPSEGGERVTDEKPKPPLLPRTGDEKRADDNDGKFKWDNGRFPKRPRGGKDSIKGASVVAATDTVDRAPELQRHVFRFELCVPAQLRQERLELTLEGSLTQDGSLRGARVLGGDALPGAVRACLIDTMHSIRLTPPDDGAVVISFPLTLGR